MNSEISRLLEVKKKINKKRPNFIREGSQNSVRIGKKWRKPRGLHSKMRHQAAGHRARVKTGFMSPSKTRNLDKDGFCLVLVDKIDQIDKLDPKVHKLILSSKLGKKKLLVFLEKSHEKGFKISFFKDPIKKMEEIKANFKKEQEKRKIKKKSKSEKKAKSKKKKPELEEKILTEEDKKKKDNKELEKIITKRE
jgi:large subunit ribosomal protein L32e